MHVEANVEPRLPFFSERVVARNAPPSTKSFGSTWQEVVTRVEAFGIEATAEKIIEIDNYTHDETRESLVDYYQNLTTHLFILLPGEYVRRVDVSSTPDSVTGLKLYTSKRITPWFGACRGAREVFQADEGYCINALSGKSGSEGCSELGVVYAPKEIAYEGHSAVMRRGVSKRVIIDSRPKAWVAKHLTWADEPRAIVVKTTSTSVEGVRIVTPAEYDRIVRYSGSFEHTGQEQWFVLVEGERIQAVGVDIFDRRLVAVRFRTNLQTTQAFGTANRAERLWLQMDDGVDDWHPTTCIHGFEFESTNTSGEAPITAFGTIQPPQAPETEDATEGRAADAVLSLYHVD